MTIGTVVTMVPSEADVELGNCGPVVVAASGVDLETGAFGVIQVDPDAVSYESLEEPTPVPDPEPDPTPDPDPSTP